MKNSELNGWKYSPKFQGLVFFLLLVKMTLTWLQVSPCKAFMETDCVKFNSAYNYSPEKQCSRTDWNEGDFKPHTQCQELQSGDKGCPIIVQMVYFNSSCSTLQLDSTHAEQDFILKIMFNKCPLILSIYIFYICRFAIVLHHRGLCSVIRIMS